METERRQKLLIGVIALLLILAVMPVMTFATVPGTINYQGYLTDSGGNPIGSGGAVTRGITFTIYDAASGGTSKWTENHTSVSVINGIFSVILGDTTAGGTSLITPVGILSGGSRWLGVKVTGETLEMTPRQKLTGAAYSIRANLAEDLSCTSCVSQSELNFTPFTSSSDYGRNNVSST
ncbi:MAG: hypothetical protein ACYTEE_10980, partial [Planctomycetota bacterium]